MNLTISEQIRSLFPEIRIGILTGEVSNQALSTGIWSQIKAFISSHASGLSAETIRDIPAIKNAKNAYRRLGKDPNRYRVSAEAMLRRIASGKGLYQINALVDCLNFTSISTGITIGGFDLSKIHGDLILDIGTEKDEFEAIGRGILNIAKLPVYRDAAGAIGSPTSDSTRTMIGLETRAILMVITDFSGSDDIDEALQMLNHLIIQNCNGHHMQISYA